MINLDTICNKTLEEAFLHIHENITIPQISVVFILTNLIFLIVGMIMLTSKEGKNKFFQIFFMSLIINGLIFVFILMFPMLIQQIFNIFS